MIIPYQTPIMTANIMAKLDAGLVVLVVKDEKFHVKGSCARLNELTLPIEPSDISWSPISRGVHD